MTEDDIEFVIRSAVASAADNARLPLNDAERDRLVDGIMKSAEWMKRARAVWGTPALQTS